MALKNSTPLLIALCLTIFSETAHSASPMKPEHPIPPADQILMTLRAGHPRVMAGPDTFDNLKALVKKGGLPSEIYAEIKTQADIMLKEPPAEYEKRDGRRLLYVSNDVLNRVQTLALVCHLEGDPRYAQRAWKELESAAAFPDWNPAHFLDTSTMTHAFALGYDWLYDYWTAKQRDSLCKAIAALGLRPGLEVYASEKRGWHLNNNNWNQVCNGGLISGALAIADQEPALAAQIVYKAVKSIPLAMEEYGPDGGGREGATYWGYGSRYNIILMEALKTALGTDFGLSQIDAFRQSGFFQIYLSGFKRISFDFADCALRGISEPQHLWMARTYKMPVFSWFRLHALKSGERGQLHDLLWFDESGEDFDPATLPLDRHFRRAECASMRSSWEPDALRVAIQAGDTMNLGGHRHLDLGSFILEALGERWIIDSGKDTQTYMRHINKNPRHFYYCVRAEGHNLPVFNPDSGPDQDPTAKAEIIKFESAPQHAMAIVDLSEAYRKDAEKVQRTFMLEDRKRLILTDDLQAIEPSELWWFLQTKAAIALANQNRTATLTRNGKALLIRLLQPANASFEVLSCQPLPTSPNPELQKNTDSQRRLTLHMTGVQKTRIKLSFEPVSN